MKNTIALKESESSYYEYNPATVKRIAGGLAYYQYTEPSIKVKVSKEHGKQLIKKRY